ncbi:MAG: putative Ig domain-containing protein, partial [Shewanella sp.]
NSASFISSVSFSVPSELVSYNNISLVGAYNKNYYALLQSNYDASTKLARFTLNNNQLLLTQDVHLPPEAANDFMPKIIFANKNTIVALHENDDNSSTGKTQYNISICKLNADGEIAPCEYKELLDNESLLDFNEYDL